MCLILLSIGMHADNPLIVAANRDEFYDRPASPLAFWYEAPQVLAGRDLRGGGTWMGIAPGGRIGALTNYRDPSSLKENAPSRGVLVANFLKGVESPRKYLERIRTSARRYNPFNLLAGDQSGLYYYSNRSDEIRCLDSGLYGLSNHLLDTPWPKVRKGKDALEAMLKRQKRVLPADLFDILMDRSLPPDHLLPDTGVGLEWERLLSPVFITGRTYGTRSATALIVNRSGRSTIAERTFAPPGEGMNRSFTRTYRLMLPQERT
ncbi:MAG: NRDE family protein [Thermodesulfobacteriota bacterium]